MIKRILVASVARSDFSITRPVIKKMVESNKFIVSKIISATKYLGEDKEIEIEQYSKSDFLIHNSLENDSPEQVNLAISNIIKESSNIFYKFKPDLLILTGDRYEMLSMAVASISFNLPIAHIHGGETSLGSFDEQSRHSITKLSHIHFPATKNAAKKIQKMGEPIKNITLAGAPALDGFLSKKRSKEESFLRLASKFKIDFSDEIILITFHPVTIDIDNEMDNLKIIFDALSTFQNKLIFTSPGADPRYKMIMDKIQDFINKNKNSIFVKSFGDKYYYDILNVSKLMFGNSSSGIIEAASLYLPVVNVGKRQLGRETSRNVIHSNINKKNLIYSIKKGLSDEFAASCKKVKNIYYHGGASEKICNKISSINEKKLIFNNIYNL